jgi:hypothetical protein
MNLRNRSLLILGLTFFAFFIIIAAVMLSVTLSGLDRIEKEDLADAINQTQSAIRSESATLLGTVQDWAWWDEMYQFATVHNMDFIRRNADTNNMATIRVHLFMVLDENGNLVYDRISRITDQFPILSLPLSGATPGWRTSLLITREHPVSWTCRRGRWSSLQPPSCIQIIPGLPMERLSWGGTLHSVPFSGSVR